MGDRAQEIGPHFFPFVFRQKIGLAFGLGGEGAGDEGNHQQGEKGEGIAGVLEIEGPVRVGKDEVDTDHTQYHRHKAVEITAGEPGDQQYRQNKDWGGKAVNASGGTEKGTEQNGTEEDGGSNQKVPPGDGEERGSPRFAEGHARPPFVCRFLSV